ncbi:MAG TPA: ABC transporter ATP-binding protein [Actinomycetales bacterium]|nr:ABC transporter ATP-binding protein [Actinomycetales bacterium]
MSAGPRGGGPRGGGPRGHGGAAFDPTARVKNLRATVGRLLSHLRPQRVQIIVVVVLSALGVLFSVLGPKLLGNATDIIFRGVAGKMVGDTMPAGTTRDEAIEAMREAGQDEVADMLGAVEFVPGQGIDFGALGQVALTVLGIFFLAALANLLAARILTRVIQRVGFELRETVQAKVDRVPLNVLEGGSRGDTLSRLTNDIDNVTQVLQQTLSQVVTSVLTVVGVLSMMVWISPTLSIIALIIVPLAAFVTTTIMRRSQPQFVRQWKSTGNVTGIVEESFTGHDVVTTFGAQDHFRREFGRENEALYDSSFRAQFLSGLMMPSMMVLSNISYVAIAVVGGLRILSGHISLGSVQAFIQYSRQFNQPLTQLASMANLVQSGGASAERVFELLDAEEESVDVSTGTLPAEVGDVRFEDVDFSYIPGIPVITGLSLHAAPGQTVAIVGHTGAGKTTLVNLLMRFNEVDSGRILVDGVDTSTVPRDELRSRMGMVLQDTWLMEDTIAANIAFAKPDASREEIEAAARATNLDHHVRTLPDGYETIVTDESLSAGEKQLLTIARAFLSDPQILVLDEATSSVDTRTELLVQQAMTELRRGRTAFIIAHRLSTIRDADLIVVMENGDVVEKGTHAHLLERGGAYARLYRSQFEAPADEN